MTTVITILAGLAFRFLQRLALPEGALKGGGQPGDWLYFERVPPEDITRVAFQAGLINAETGRTFREIRIPFIVE